MFVLEQVPPKKKNRRASRGLETVEAKARCDDPTSSLKGFDVWALVFLFDQEVLAANEEVILSSIVGDQDKASAADLVAMTKRFACRP